MLDYLRIRDLALIADMELEFSPGMNVLTGETGAGKSFILKALNFLMGERLKADMVRPGKKKAQVEALFTLSDKEWILRRELNAETGRSRLYVNDNLSSQEFVKELRPSLLLHTSQHGQQRLLHPAFQMALVDHWLEERNTLEQKNVLVKELREIGARQENLKARFHNLADRRELLEMHLKEIEKVAPEPGEEEHLETLRAELRSSEHIRRTYERARNILRGNETGFIEQLGQLEHVLGTLVEAENDEELSTILETLISFRETCSELDHRLRHPPVLPADIDSEQVESRLFELAQLKRKLHRSLPEIFSLKTEIEENLSFLDACNLDIRQLAKQEKFLRSKLTDILKTLAAQRRDAGTAFTQALEKELRGLGFSEYIRVIAEYIPYELYPGCEEERVRFLWSPNPGQPAQPLDRIASGGELSRFMLGVISIQRDHEESTLVFDEVDAGVGGITLNRVADRLEALASQRQMLLITHWPQLASRAVRHFQVTKQIDEEETFTLCRQLEGEDKEKELARMTGIE